MTSTNGRVFRLRPDGVRTADNRGPLLQTGGAGPRAAIRTQAHPTRPVRSGDMRVDAIYGAIGRFSVRFRWLVLLVWVLGAIAASTQLPSLASVTQGNNQKFLPASAPSSKAADLAAPFGTAGQFPVPVVAAASSGPLTPADTAALTSLQTELRTVPNVSRVID